MELSHTWGHSTALSNRLLQFIMQRTTRWFSLLFFFAMLWSLVTVTPAHAAGRASAPDIATIDAFITSAMQEKRIPGVGLAVVNETQVLHVRGFGRANEQGEAVTPQTPFMIGSSSKSFTALAIMQLVEAGKVELDAPVQRYLPWWHLADPVQSSQVTVADLLHQTSGLPATLGGKEWLLNPDDQGLTLETGVRSFASVSFEHPIGSFTYSNANYETLSLLVQTVSGEAFGAYLKHHIFAPLSMTRSTMSLQEAKQEGLQQGYTWRYGFPQPVDNVYSAAVAGAGMITSTAEDMAHYLSANMQSGSYGSGSVLSPQGMATLHTGDPLASFDGVPFSATGHYAMGWINIQQPAAADAASPVVFLLSDGLRFHLGLPWRYFGGLARSLHLVLEFAWTFCWTNAGRLPHGSRHGRTCILWHLLDDVQHLNLLYICCILELRKGEKREYLKSSSKKLLLYIYPIVYRPSFIKMSSLS